MSLCIVCKVSTTKYRCPNCFERYCSLSCCKVHKESCSEHVTGKTEDIAKTEKTPALRDVAIEFKYEVDDEVTDDRVPEELLQRLGQSSELKEVLTNPHLRAMMENLVNTDHPEEAIARAMQEPIFTEFADVCLNVVDKDNPNLQPEGVP